jgi:hypothetical protein
MPKQNKGGMKRKPSGVAPVTPKPNGHSLIVRSAESLGRMIGALQRQLEAVAAKAGADGHGPPVTKRRQSPRKSTGKGNARHTGGKSAAGTKGGRGQR